MAVSQRGIHLRLRVFGAFLSAQRGLEMAAGTGTAGKGAMGAGVSCNLSSGVFLLFWRDGAGASFLFSGSVWIF